MGTYSLKGTLKWKREAEEKDHRVTEIGIRYATGFEEKGEPQIKESWWPPKAGKGTEMDFALDYPEEIGPVNTLILAN